MMYNGKDRHELDAFQFANDFDSNKIQGTLEQLQEIGRTLQALAIEGHTEITSFSVKLSRFGARIDVRSTQSRFVSHPYTGGTK